MLSLGKKLKKNPHVAAESWGIHSITTYTRSTIVATLQSLGPSRRRDEHHVAGCVVGWVAVATRHRQ